MVIKLLLTNMEKASYIKRLEKGLAKGEIDQAWIPYLKEINAMDSFATVWCCSGHGEHHPYVIIRTKLPLDYFIPEINRFGTIIDIGLCQAGDTLGLTRIGSETCWCEIAIQPVMPSFSLSVVCIRHLPRIIDALAELELKYLH